MRAIEEIDRYLGHSTVTQRNGVDAFDEEGVAPVGEFLGINGLHRSRPESPKGSRVLAQPSAEGNHCQLVGPVAEHPSKPRRLVATASIPSSDTEVCASQAINDGADLTGLV